MAVHVQGDAHPGHDLEEVVGDPDLRQDLLGVHDLIHEFLLPPMESIPEVDGVVLELQVELHDLHPLAGVLYGRDLGVEGHPVEELGAELPLLGVHGADEDEPGGVLDGDALPLHRVPP